MNSKLNKTIRVLLDSEFSGDLIFVTKGSTKHISVANQAVLQSWGTSNDTFNTDKVGDVFVCVNLTSSRGGLPSDAVPTARQIHPPQRLWRHTPSDSAHQFPPGKNVNWRVSLGNVDKTVTANLRDIPWSPSDVLPSVSLCDT